MDGYKEFICALAEAARRETLPRWRECGAAENKAGGSAYDPVTEADRAAERAIRALIEEAYPEHGIAGEEYADRPAGGPYVWSIDPIDGTRAFVFGLPSWTTLIALLEDGAPALGLIDAPRMGERYVGHGPEGRLIAADGERPLRASQCRSLSEARFATTDPYLFKGVEREGFERLREEARLTRYGLDAYAYARLADGTIDLVVESGLKPHDYNALIPVVRAAGGMVGDWNGGSDFSQGRIIAAATPQLFDEALRLLSP
jgi:myo-inositol-1(or 4)-monophosphatase